MISVIHARFAGGLIAITPNRLEHAPDTPVVLFGGPGFDFALFPHEARAIAAALVTAAADAEARNFS